MLQLNNVSYKKFIKTEPTTTFLHRCCFGLYQRPSSQEEAGTEMTYSVLMGTLNPTHSLTEDLRECTA